MFTTRFHRKPRLEMLEDRTLLSGNPLDPSFGSGGKVVTPVSDYSIQVTLQSSGKIVVIGASHVGRYNTDGTLDTTFGTNGIASFSAFQVDALAVQADDAIVLAGIDRSAPTLDFAVARLDSNGHADTAFG